MTPNSSDVLETGDPDTSTTDTVAAPAGLTRKQRVLLAIVTGVGRLRARLGTVLLVVVMIAAVAVAATVYFTQYRPDQQIDAAAADAARAAAVDGAVAVLSYSPDTFDQDLAAAQTYLTGDFLDYYSKFAQQVVAPAAKDKAVKTSAVVGRSAVSDMHADSARVLLFINQTTTSNDKPDPAVASSSVLATMTKVDDKWLISAFNPV